MHISVTSKQHPSLLHHHGRLDINNSSSSNSGLLSPLSPPDLDARPSTAPTQSTPADIPPSAFGLLFNPRASVRKSPTLNDIADIHIAKRPARVRRLSSASSTSKNSPSGLLSPIFPIDNANPRSPSISERRSPSARRPPASFSANGIETSFGPPPSLITRSSNYHSELAIYAQNPAASALAAQQHKSYNSKNQPSRTSPQRADSGTSLTAQSRDRTADWANTKAQTVLSPEPVSMKRLDSLDAVMTHNQSNAWSQGPISDMSYQSGELPTSEQQHKKKDKSDGGVESSQSSEDLFLKMALDNSEQRDTDLERRQSRGRRSSLRNSNAAGSEASFSTRRRNTSPQEASLSSKLAAQNAGMEQRKVSGAASVIGIPSRTPSMSTEQKFNAYRSRYMQTTPQTPSVVSKASDFPPGKRRPSVPDNLLSRPHTYRPSRLNYSSTRVPEDSPQTDRGSFVQERADGDSVVSTVQSAVWDEMQEMKSHVQRVEPNWRFPSGGGASNGSAERPRTATTTVTTISSSPKLPMKSVGMSPTSSRGVAEAANIHPLLHQSLARCKPLVSPTLHRALENAASDALDMAVWSRTTGPQGSIYSSASAINGVTGDRQLRRKADNLCRNLTELCIALIEVKQETPDRVSTSFGQRRESRDVSSAMAMSPSETLSKPYSRNASLEPEEVRATPSRALERVEARRASYNLNTPPASSPRESTYSAATQRQSQPVSNNTSPQVASLLRSGTSLLRSRRLPTEVEDDQPTLRAPSRAVTEIGTIRKRSDRIASGFGLSRIQDQEHTQHPLPLPHSNTIRRVTGGNSDQPTTPGLLRGAARRYLDREKTSNTLSIDGTTDDEKKMKRRSWGLYAGSSGTSSAGGRSLTLGRGNSLNKGARTSLTAGGGD